MRTRQLTCVPRRLGTRLVPYQAAVRLRAAAIRRDTQHTDASRPILRQTLRREGRCPGSMATRRLQLGSAQLQRLRRTVPPNLHTALQRSLRPTFRPARRSPTSKRQPVRLVLLSRQACRTCIMLQQQSWKLTSACPSMQRGLQTESMLTPQLFEVCAHGGPMEALMLQLRCRRIAPGVLVSRAQSVLLPAAAPSWRLCAAERQRVACAQRRRTWQPGARPVACPPNCRG